MPVRTELPTRVVYVGTDDGNDPPRLYSSNGEIAGYVALSYCWGGSQRHQTERSRIERYTHALPLEGLPKSLQDAILLTRALGIQYIWIDSLCIIQDCDEDKHREMARMANIYKNTIFTISAARAKSCHEGFLGVQDKRVLLLQTSIQLPMNCLNGAIGSVLLYPTRTQFGREHTPIDKRAWTYQEQVLSRRLVSFFDNAVEWTCPSCHLSDDRLGTDETNVTNPAYKKTLAPLSGRSSFVSRGLYLVSKWRDKLLETRATLPPFWWGAVQEFALGSLSNLDDRLPAIAGIASEFHDLTGDVYVAGLWRSHLIKGLQWVVWEQLEEPSDNTGNKDIKYNAPTWTWASVHGYGIRAPTKRYDLDSNRVEVIDCNVNLVSLSAPFGSVNGGELKIRAPLKCLSYRQIEETMIMYHSVEDRDGGGFIGRIFFDRRSWRHADELTTLRGGAAPHIESTEIWFLGLSKHADLSYEFSGLALAKRADGLFERVGHFQIYVGDEWLRHRTAEKDEFRASWGNSYVVTTVTIV
ncbi:hypothetical protein CUC08_Gglean003674 [Alternaria sp. MG1]|nr:hypothetical protein CUC08_Gglean003674 [Alternaria sp. MG1]